MGTVGRVTTGEVAGVAACGFDVPEEGVTGVAAEDGDDPPPPPDTAGVLTTGAAGGVTLKSAKSEKFCVSHVTV